jgi:ribosome biogenesis protein ENP2
MKVSELNGVKIYDLSSGKSLPEYMEEAKKRKVKLKNLEEYSNRISLIQDLEYADGSAQRVKISEDNNYIVTSGVYPPRVKIFETSDLSMKCERGIDSEVLQFQILGNDYTKLAFLCADRNIELHAQYGRHFKIRIPKFGRDMVYSPFSCDLVTVGATNEIYRLNLDLGRFQSPFESQSPELTSVDFSKDINAIAVGGIDGRVEFWDSDSNSKASELLPRL